VIKEKIDGETVITFDSDDVRNIIHILLAIGAGIAIWYMSKNNIPILYGLEQLNVIT
jgi:hypothetical protein